MIVSTIPLLYDARNGEKKAIIEIIVTDWKVNDEGITYVAKDYAINNNIREYINEKSVLYSWDKIVSLNDYLESLYSYQNLNKKELEFAKVKHALLLETQTHPVYGSLPVNWVLSEEI
ncbi:hypothetical protein LNQ49_12700 [Flavobacterium sp. F-65]|uniref:Uncharacterized protein n=1 Tax=Flavobacterium pisciphilum TaxID=2893755 RepID=A0ABS8MUL0_9FLAO|nr:hypothetical protein [Flavobacterium sp. F-65]MCC9072442.1 hypothetical protein [Flavobacterium sp. F-65]